VVGLSGGGPTALACGVVLRGQVSAVATVGGVAPLVPRDPSLPGTKGAGTCSGIKQPTWYFSHTFEPFTR
jgi:hypothetical protein